MEGALENAYFKWLCAKVIEPTQPSTPSITYWRLLKILHTTEFVWVVRGDDNRVEDGLELRVEFILELNIPENPDWRALGCSVLEMLIAFSRRAQFITGVPAREWFWEFINNLNLRWYNDGADFTRSQIDNILDKFIWRTYNSNGEGGILPIINNYRDQRQVELWYQFAEYLEDHNKIA